MSMTFPRILHPKIEPEKEKPIKKGTLQKNINAIEIKILISRTYFPSNT